MDDSARKQHLKNIVQWWAVEGVLQGKECEAHGTNPKTHIPYKQAIEYYKWYSVEQGFEYQPFSEHLNRGGFFPPHRNHYRTLGKYTAERQRNQLDRIRGGLTEILHGSPNLSQEEFEAVQSSSKEHLSTCKLEIQNNSNTGDNSKQYKQRKHSAEMLIDAVQNGIFNGMSYQDYRKLMREVIAEARAVVKFQCSDAQFAQVASWGAAKKEQAQTQPPLKEPQPTIKDEPQPTSKDQPEKPKIGFIKPIVAILTAGFAAFAGDSKQPEGMNNPNAPRGNWFQRNYKSFLRVLAGLTCLDMLQAMVRGTQPIIGQATERLFNTRNSGKNTLPALPA
jgi:hypothetical protein